MSSLLDTEVVTNNDIKLITKSPNKCFAVNINGVAIDIVVNNYIDRYFIIITQFQKLGTLISVEKDVAKSEGETRDVYTTKVLLGNDNDDVHVAARFLGGQLNLTKPCIFSLSLKDLGAPVLRAISKILKENL